MRDSFIIIGLALVAGIIGAFLYFRGNILNMPSSSASGAQPSTTAVPFMSLARGSKSTVATRVNYLITSSDELIKLWKMVDATGTPPAVDFSTHNVIAVFAGKESTSSIAVAKIEDASARLVSIALTKPDSACAAKLAAPAPYEIVVVPATTLSLAHKDLATTADCPK